jgi:hypothetical protein
MTTDGSDDPRVVVDQMAVLSQYGRAMLNVQLFEAQLAMVAMLAGVGEPGKTRRVPARDELRKTLNKMFHWLWKASAAEARNEAEKVLPAEFGPDIENAINGATGSRTATCASS